MKNKAFILLPISAIALVSCNITFNFPIKSDSNDQVSSSYINDGSTSSEGSHSWITTLYEPSCEKDGYTLYKCMICGTEEKRDIVDALGHSWGDGTLLNEGDCSHKSKYYHACTRCGKVEEYEGEYGSHDYETITIEPTCTEDGYTCSKCSICGDIASKTDFTHALGHTYGDWIVEKEATTTNEGERYKTCTKCGYKYSESIPMLDDVEVDYSSMSTITLDSTNNDGLSASYSTGCYQSVNIESNTYKCYRTFGLSTSGFVKLIGQDYSQYCNVPNATLGGSFSNYNAIKGIKKIEIVYSTNKDAKLYYGATPNLVTYEKISSSATNGMFEFKADDVNYFRLESGSGDCSVTSIKIYYKNSGTVIDSNYGSSGAGLYRLNPMTVSSTPTDGDKVSVPIEITVSGNSYTVTKTKEYTYYSYEYISNHSSYADSASWIEPMDVANYFCIFKTYPANYVLKKDASEAKTIFGDKTRCVSKYSRTDGYAQAVPYKGTPTYYECDIDLNGEYSANNRGVGRLVVWATGYDANKGANGYDSNPVAVFTDDHYSTFTEYYNNGTWSKRYNSYYSSDVGLSNVTNYIYGAPTTL